jgi:tetratricopeptide (TPR) repeat protein
LSFRRVNYQKAILEIALPIPLCAGNLYLKGMVKMSINITQNYGVNLERQQWKANKDLVLQQAVSITKDYLKENSNQKAKQVIREVALLVQKNMNNASLSNEQVKLLLGKLKGVGVTATDAANLFEDLIILAKHNNHNASRTKINWFWMSDRVNKTSSINKFIVKLSEEEKKTSPKNQSSLPNLQSIEPIQCECLAEINLIVAESYQSDLHYLKAATKYTEAVNYYAAIAAKHIGQSPTNRRSNNVHTTKKTAESAKVAIENDNELNLLIKRSASAFESASKINLGDGEYQKAKVAKTGALDIYTKKENIFQAEIDRVRAEIKKIDAFLAEQEKSIHIQPEEAEATLAKQEKSIHIQPKEAEATLAEQEKNIHIQPKEAEATLAEQAANIYAKHGLFRIAAETYLQAGLTEKAAENYIAAGMLKEAAEVYIEANLLEQAAEASLSAGLTEQAVAIYQKAGFLEIADKIQQPIVTPRAIPINLRPFFIDKRNYLILIQKYQPTFENLSSRFLRIEDAGDFLTRIGQVHLKRSRTYIARDKKLIAVKYQIKAMLAFNAAINAYARGGTRYEAKIGMVVKELTALFIIKKVISEPSA